MMVLRRRNIVRALQQILEQVAAKLPANNVQDAQELIDHDEWLVALELICTQLYEYAVPISRETLSLIERAGQLMKVPANTWSYLRELVIDSVEMP